MTTAHDFTVKTIDGADQSLGDFAGQTLLIVNVASACGLTPQYGGLEALYEANKDKGFAVLGFPCNQFGAQEPGTEDEIKTFCETSFGVTFPMFSKIEVNGEGAHPLYQYLRAAAKESSGKDEIEWNFAKFLVNGQGEVVKRFGAQETPEEITADVVAVIGK